MSALFSPTAGGAGFAANIAQLLPRRAVKPSDVAIAASTTLTNDSALFVAVDANAEYDIFAKILYTQGTVGQLNMGWTGPTSATMDWTALGLATSVTAAANGVMDVSSQTITGTKAVGGAIATACSVVIFGRLVVSTTAGTLQFRWAQSSGSATGTTVKTNSVLIARQIA